MHHMNKSLVVALVVCAARSASAQAVTESFDDVTQLSARGWVIQNASEPVGVTTWFQGLPASSGNFDAASGAANSYIAANYNSAGDPGTINNWLLSPNRTFGNGTTVTFWTRKMSPDDYADRLEVRLSTNGASTYVGAGVDVGNFETLLVAINPTLTLGVYPIAWTQYTVTLSGFSAPFSGRIAWRYFVTDGGLSGSNGDYIGIDDVTIGAAYCGNGIVDVGEACDDGNTDDTDGCSSACAHLPVVVDDEPPLDEEPAPADDDGEGCQAAPRDGLGLAVLLALGLVRRRRRRL